MPFEASSPEPFKGAAPNRGGPLFLSVSEEMISRWLLYTASNPKAVIRVSTQFVPYALSFALAEADWLLLASKLYYRTFQ